MGVFLLYLLIVLHYISIVVKENDTMKMTPKERAELRRIRNQIVVYTKLSTQVMDGQILLNNAKARLAEFKKKHPKIKD